MNQKKENTNTKNYFRPKYLLFLLTLIFSFFLSTQAFASTYYVATTGLDTNAGTLALPFKTIQKAADIVNPGDTVYIRGGVYQSYTSFYRSGTSSSPITILPYPSEKPIIDGNNYTIPSGVWNSLLGISGDYINVTGLEVRYSSGIGVGVRGAHIIVTDMTVHHTIETGVLITGNYSIVQDSTVYSACMNNVDGALLGTSSSWATGLSAARSPIGAIIRNNIVHDIWGEGISTYEATGTLIENNISYDNFSANIYISDSTNVVVQKNFVYRTKEMTNGSQVGILLGDEKMNPVSSNIKILNNIVYGGKRNLYWWGSNGTNGMTNVLIANNTLVNSTDYSTVRFADSGTDTGVVFKNNIISQNGAIAPIILDKSSGFTFSNNLWSSTPNAFASGSGDIIGDAKLSNIASPYLASSFNILSSSPAINTGTIVSSVTDDYLGVTRPKGSAYDIGAYESNYTAPITYTLTYTAGTGGTISGTLSQTINSGSNGTSVTAVPSTGYSFSSWSDGITTASRTETNVTANKSVTANFTLTVSSNIHYISPTGLDTNIGTISQPWKTLAYACSQATASGDIIHVNPGTYNETSRCDLSVGVNIVGEGNSSHIISSYYLADSNYGAISLHSTTAGTNGNQSISYIKLDGNNLTSYCGIAVYKRSNVHIDHSTIVDFQLCGINLRGDAITSSLSDPGSDPSVYQVGNEVSNSTIINCSDRVVGYSGLIKHDSQDGLLIHDNILTQNSRPDGHNGNIISAWGGHDKNVKYYRNIMRKKAVDTANWNFHMEVGSYRGGVEIYNNEFWGGVGIDLASYDNTKGASTYSCWIHDNLFDSDYKIASTENPHEPYFAVELEGGSQDVIISNNLVRNKPGGFSVVLGQTPRTVKNIQIYNNIEENMGYADGGWSVTNQVSSYSTGNIFQDIYFYNNTIILNQSKTAFWIVSTDNVSNIYIKNNIIKNTATGVGYGWLAFSDYTGIIDKIYLENNLVYNNPNNNNPYYRNGKVVTNVSEVNTIKLDPLFNSSTDFHIQSTSPAINTGTTISYITNDYDGVTRPKGSAYDIGAYESNYIVAPTTYTISYTPGTGGTISGTLSQTINSGSNGTSVTAVPSTGYSFSSWSDGITTASRTETNVTANKTITATFTIIPTSGGGGGGGGGGGYTPPVITPPVVVTPTISPITTITPIIIQPTIDKGCTSGNTFSITTGKLCPKTNTPSINTLKLTKTVRYGSRLNDRNEVKILQQILITKGYLTGTADGIFGRVTLASVKAFQTANGLKSDGIVGAGTREVLNR